MTDKEALDILSGNANPVAIQLGRLTGKQQYMKAVKYIDKRLKILQTIENNSYGLVMGQNSEGAHIEFTVGVNAYYNTRERVYISGINTDYNIIKDWVVENYEKRQKEISGRN